MNLKTIAAVLGTLAAIATIIGLFISVFALWQSAQDQLKNAQLQATVSANQSTSIAIQATVEANQRAQIQVSNTLAAIADKQLEVQKTSAAVQVQPQPSITGPAVADVISLLKATSDVLENQRRAAEATQTVLAKPLPTIPSTTCPQFFLDQGHVPQGSTMMSIKVDPGTIHVMTSGPICVKGICLPGGERRGSIVVLLPSETPYVLTGLNPPYNWHGACYGSPDQWRVVAEDRAAVMKRPNTDNCINNQGCAVVDVLVVSGNSTIAQYIR